MDKQEVVARASARVASFAVLAVVGACGSSGDSSMRGPLPPSTAPQHPLDALTATEIRTAVAVLRNHGAIDALARFPEIALQEPTKEEVLAWRSGDRLPRKARVVVVDRKPVGTQSYEAVVDVVNHRVEAWQRIARGQPMIMSEEYERAGEAVRNDARWRAAMKARGIEDPGELYLDVWAPGEKAVEGAGNARVCRVLTFHRGEDQSPYGPPIEGVVAAVDLRDDKVLEVLDHGVRKVADARTDFYDPDVTGPDREALPPLSTELPDGPGFAVDGREVRWENWRLRCSFTPREGLVLHQVAWQDSHRLRDIVYRASLAEMMVPYADPSDAWSWRSAFDGGEYGLGKLAAELDPGTTVPAHALLFDAVSADDRGEPEVQKGVVAVWERDAGFLWCHYDTEHGTAARRARELVVGTIATIGNYDYACNWVFAQDGVLSLEVVLTGCLLTKGVAAERCAVCDEGAATDAAAAAEQRTGTLVAPNLLAPNHQHFVAVRLDLDVDGADNKITEVEVQAVPPGASNPRGNAFGAVRTVLASESAARRAASPATHRCWEVASATVRNATGHAAGYTLHAGVTSVPYLQKDHALTQLGAFAQQAFCATRQRDGELFAAGRYPGQNREPDGLARYLADDESLRGDVVVWYTIGVTHLPRPEEFPIMSATKVGFELKPTGFFDRNPGLDVPRAAGQ